MDVVELHRRSVDYWTARVAGVGRDDGDLPTPCRDWDVHALVNHVVGEDRWTAPLLAGRTMQDVGTALDGDLLGDDLPGSAGRAADEALRAAAAPGAAERTVHLSYGDETASEYLCQLAADHLVHGWDLAVATGQDAELPAALRDEVAGWFVEREEMYRGAGLLAPPVQVGADAGASERLIAATGRDAAWTSALGAVERFGAALKRGDVDAVMALMTEDCVFEATSPAPDGRRVEGAPAVRAEWEALFSGTPDASWTWEEVVAAGDRATVRWRFGWRGADGVPGHVRGVDLLRLRRGKVAEKLSYVKG